MSACLILDLPRATYVPSTGIALLSTLLAKAEFGSDTLVLFHMPPRVRNIMDAFELFYYFAEERREGGKDRA